MLLREVKLLVALGWRLLGGSRWGKWAVKEEENLQGEYKIRVVVRGEMQRLGSLVFNWQL